MSNRFYQIENEVAQRVAEIDAAHGNWPCRKGCADCCRSLAAEPRVSREEWDRIERALAELPEARERIRAMAGAPRPVTCGLLDLETDSCRIYDARPVECRAYGFYAERGDVLGCGRIEALAEQTPDVIWGNHAALAGRLKELGETRELSKWLTDSDSPRADDTCCGNSNTT